MSKRGAFLAVLVVTMALLVGCGGTSSNNADTSSKSTGSTPNSSASTSGSLFTGKAYVVTADEYAQIRDGMSYEEVVNIIGEEGEEVSSSELAGIKTVMYQWINWDGSNMNAMFQNGKLVSKAQFGLK